MKRILMVAVLSSLGIALNAQSITTKEDNSNGKTKYICALNLPEAEYTTEFETLEECRKSCDVCEKTEAKTVVTSDLDE